MSTGPRRFAEPTEGTYAIRFVKRGPMVPVRLYRRADGMLTADVNGEPQPYAYTPSQVEFLMMAWAMGGDGLTRDAMAFARIVAFGREIDTAEYDRRLARLAWAKENAPDDSCMHPYEPIDLTKKPSLW